MNGDVGQLLRQAVPEPPRGLDPDRVLGAARRRRRARATVVAAAAAVVLVTAVSSLVQLQGGGNPSTQAAGAAPATVSALDRRVPIDGLPEGVAGVFEGLDLVHPGEVSLVGTAGRSDVYIAETSEDLCLWLVVEGRDGSVGAGGGCNPRSDLVTGGVNMAIGGDTDADPLLAVVVVPDGYVQAVSNETTVAVLNNVVILEVGSSRGDLTVSGPDVPDLVLSLDDIVGPVQGTEPLDREGNARLALGNLALAAEQYALEHGSTEGFADEMAELGGAVAGQLVSLTDTSAVADIGDGECLTVDLQTGGISKAPC